MNSVMRSLIKLNKTRFVCYQQIANLSLSSSNLSQSFKYSDLEVELTKNPSKKPDDPLKIPFGHVYTDHMLMVKWNSKDGWSKPRIEPLKNLSIHPGAKVLHYAVEVFEGLKAYRCVDGKIRLFRPELNMKRLYRSSVRTTLPEFDQHELLKCMKQLITIEKDWVPNSTAASLYIRPAIIGTEGKLGLGPSNEALLYILCSPTGPYFQTVYKPISLLAEPAYVRSWLGGVGDFKCGSNYGPTVYVSREANKQGCQQVLWLYGEDQLVTEAGTMNVFFVIKNKKQEIELVTPPSNGLILEGITRQSVLELTRKWADIKVIEREIGMTELLELCENNQLLEMFGTGTAVVVCPIDRILYKNKEYKIPTILNGATIMREIGKQINDIQYGRTSSDWMQTVV